LCHCHAENVPVGGLRLLKAVEEQGISASVLVCFAAKCFNSFSLLPNAWISLGRSARVFLELLFLLCCASSSTPSHPQSLRFKDRQLEALKIIFFSLSLRQFSVFLYLQHFTFSSSFLSKWLCRCRKVVLLYSIRVHLVFDHAHWTSIDRLFTGGICLDHNH